MTKKKQTPTTQAYPDIFLPASDELSLPALRIIFNNYAEGDRLACLAYTEDGDLYAILSVNPPNAAEPPEDCFYMKVYSENERIAKHCFTMGIFIRTGKAIRSGFVSIPEVKINKEFF